MIELLHGDCLNRLRELPDCSVDACVTDPPYGLSFMGKAWDYDVPGAEVWREVLRVLKPGGHLLAFAGTRTQHRMAVQIEDAGFEIRDMIAWVYSTGFPKSRNLDGDWQGWGTALKPALEPITVARKPLTGTVAANVLEHGTGAINVDGCRVAMGTEYDPSKVQRQANNSTFQGKGAGHEQPTYNAAGRWPANLIHDGSDEVVGLFPQSKDGVAVQRNRDGDVHNHIYGAYRKPAGADVGYNGGGSAARFFYCAKASKKDRDEGLTLPPQSFVQFQTGNGASGKPSSLSEGRDTQYRNTHPTVKPTELMRYLCRLVTPPGGVVLDPFMGSGTTGKAAVLEGFRFIGIEREAEYLEIARGRIQLPEQGSLL
jgi:site-specific DNA-methyltransferase (adenine-specific)